MLGLCCCTGFFLVVVNGEQGLWYEGFSLQWRILLWSTALGCVGFSSCVSQAFSYSMASGIFLSQMKPIPPTLAGRFSTSEPPGKPCLSILYIVVYSSKSINPILSFPIPIPFENCKILYACGSVSVL